MEVADPPTTYGRPVEFDFDQVIDRADTDSIKWTDNDVMALGLADMDFPTAPAIREALRQRVDHGVFGYTAIGSRVLDATTSWLATRHDLMVDSEWITVGPGIMTSMAHLLRGALNPGSAVIVQTPGFMPIRTVIEANGLRCLDNPLAESDGGYVMDLDHFRALAKEPDVKAFVLCSPHNPIGRIWSRDELEAVAGVCETQGLLVISDEVHADIVHPGRTFTPYARVVAPGDRYATLLGPSKAFNLAGLRTSVAVVPDPELRSLLGAELRRVNEDFGAPVMGTVALEAAYTAGADWLDALTSYLYENVLALTRTMSEAVPGAHVLAPDASFLVWIDLRGLGFDDREIETRITRAGVAVEPGISFGPAGRRFIRVNVGTQRSRLIEAAERIGRALSE